MVLEIVYYGHPVLRQKGAAITQITPEIRTLAADMIETMYAANGVGLAAQQVGHALQLTVLDVANVEDRPSTMEVDGQAVDLEKAMPIVLINPVVKTTGQIVAGGEGCLSFPEIYAEVERPEGAEVTYTDLEGQAKTFHATGLLARAVQHEVDHLNGILFIDRLTQETRATIKPDVEDLHAATKKALIRRR